MKTKILSGVVLVGLVLVGIVLLSGCISNPRDKALMASAPPPDITQFRLINRTFEPSTHLGFYCTDNLNKSIPFELRGELIVDIPIELEEIPYRTLNERSVKYSYTDGISVRNIDYYRANVVVSRVNASVFRSRSVSKSLYAKFDDSTIYCKYILKPKLTVSEEVYLGNCPCTCNLTDDDVSSIGWILLSRNEEYCCADGGAIKTTNLSSYKQKYGEDYMALLSAHLTEGARLELDHVEDVLTLQLIQKSAMFHTPWWLNND